MARNSESSLRQLSGYAIKIAYPLSDDQETLDSYPTTPDLDFKLANQNTLKCVKFPKISKSKQSTAESDSEEDDRPILPSGKIVPIPKGKSPYALAKNAEYYDKDNVRAEQLYREAILVGDRAESSLKDLASLLHRLGKTSEAIKLLKENRHLVDDDIKKYENLIQTLQNQLNPTGNSLNKCLRVSEIEEDQDNQFVRSLFQMDKRIQNIEIRKSDGYLSAFVHFNSHSAARKTLQRFTSYGDYHIYWVSVEGEIVGNANPSKYKAEQRKQNPAFNYKMFHRNPINWVMPLAVDESYQQTGEEDTENSDEKLKLVGLELFKHIIDEVV